MAACPLELWADEPAPAAVELLAAGSQSAFGRIGALLNYIEDGNMQRKADNDTILARFSFDRQTIMKQNFDIDLSVVPE